MKKITFKTKILRHGEMDAHYICFPYNVKEIFKTGGRIPVKAKFDGEPYTGSLAPMGKELGHILILVKAIRNKIGKKEGDSVSVEITEDKSERTVEIPPDFIKALAKNKSVKETFDKMSYNHKKEYVQAIAEAKKPETRERRIQKAVEMINKYRMQKESKKIK
jgi:ribosomal protein L11